MKGTRRVFAAVLLLSPLSLVAADESSAPDAVKAVPAIVTAGSTPETFGNQNTYANYTPWDANPADSTVTFTFINTANGQGVTRTGGSPWIKVPLHIPNGALLNKIEFNYCDTGAGSFGVYLFRQPKNVPVVTTNLFGSSGTPGCVVETATLAVPEQVDNDANSYHLELIMGSTDNSVVFLGARAGYSLQVSPAPGAATFADVPTGHPQFRFIEALVAAGITAGCGGGNYCPNNNLTRGQMAVFLSLALGLHFPN